MCTEEDYIFLNSMALLPLFKDKIEISQSYLPLLDCRLLVGPEQLAPSSHLYSFLWPTVCIHFAVLITPPFIHLLRPPHLFGSEEYFHCNSNMPKLLSHSSYILRIEKRWQYWLNCSDDIFVKIIEKFDTWSYKPFFEHYF